MNKRQRYTLNALENMLVFVTSSHIPSPLKDVPPAFSEQVAALRAAIVDAQSYAIEQGSGVCRKLTRKKQHLIYRLRYQHLRPMQNIARVIESQDPGLPKLLNIPHNYFSEQSVITSARAARRDAEPHRTLFISRGLASDFLAHLDAILEEIDLTKDLHYKARTQKVSAREGLHNALSAGLKAREYLTVIIRIRCLYDEEHGPSTLKGWLSAARIRKANNVSVEVQEKELLLLSDVSDRDEVEDDEWGVPVFAKSMRFGSAG